MRHTLLIIVAIVSATLGQTLPAPIILEPTEGQVDVPVIATLRWKSVENATSYGILVALDENFIATLTNTVITDTFFVMTNLGPNQTIYWKVMAFGEPASSPYSISYFTTGILPPFTPTIVSPIGSQPMGTQPVLTWNQSATGDPDGYDIQLATDTGFTDLIVDTDVTDTTYATSGLEDLTYYYWRVRAYNSGGNSAWTGRMPFIMSIPSRPMTDYPEDGATGIALSDTLRWTKSDGSTMYTVKLSTTGNFTAPDLHMTVTDTFLALEAITVGGFPANVEPSTTYEWTVQGNHSTGTSEVSDTASFTTEEKQITIPSRPMTVYPTNGAINIALSDTLRWTKSENSTQYNVKLSKTENFENPDISCTITDTFLTLESIMDDIDPNTTYQWIVQANNSDTSSEISDTATFKTKEQVTAVAPPFKTEIRSQTHKVWVVDLRGRKVLKTVTRARIQAPRGCYILTTKGKVTKRLLVQ